MAIEQRQTQTKYYSEFDEAFDGFMLRHFPWFHRLVHRVLIDRKSPELQSPRQWVTYALIAVCVIVLLLSIWIY